MLLLDPLSKSNFSMGVRIRPFQPHYVLEEICDDQEKWGKFSIKTRDDHPPQVPTWCIVRQLLYSYLNFTVVVTRFYLHFSVIEEQFVALSVSLCSAASFIAYAAMTLQCTEQLPWFIL